MFSKLFFIFILFFVSITADDEEPNCVPRRDLHAFGDEYEGIKIDTINNVRCETWSKSIYFEFDDDEDYPFIYEEHSYCRGYKFMGHEKYGPWCFLSLSFEDQDENSKRKILWEPCFPACEDINKSCIRYYEIPFNIFDYSGNRSYSITNKTCGKWKSIYADFYGTEVRQWDHNYCRTVPVFEGIDLPFPRIPWCHPIGNHWTAWEPCFHNCHDIATCMERLEATLPYKGIKSRTVNNLICDSWTNKENTLTKLYPGTESDARFCRNFGFLSTGPFCLVDKARSQTNVTIEPCFDHCEDTSEKKPCVGPDKMRDYWGSQRKTIDGLSCQRWDVQVPHKHPYKAEDFGVDELWEISNFCRNPDSSLDGPWCFINAFGSPVRQPCFDHCSGADHQDDVTTDDKYTMITEESIPTGGEGDMQIYWIIFLVIIGVLLLSLISDLCCRQACLNSLHVDKSLDDAKVIIETCRPGVPGGIYENATKEEIENWMKLVDKHNALKKQKDQAYTGVE